MVVSDQTYRLGGADLADYLYARAGFGYSEAFSRENPPVAFSMQFRESLAELELFTVYAESPVSALFALDSIFRKTFRVDRQEVTHSCTL